MKKTGRLFIASFLITLISIFALCGFIAVDLSKQHYGSAINPILAVEKADLFHYDVSFLGIDYTLSLNTLNEFEHYRKKYAAFTTPRVIRLTSQLAFFAKERYDIYYEKYLEREYMESISS